MEGFSGVPLERMAESKYAWEGEVEEQTEKGSPSSRVKEDLSEFAKALSSKFWGVASFLAPSPSSLTPSSSPRIYLSSGSSPSLYSQKQEPTVSGDSELVDSFKSWRTAGIRSDFAEIEGTLKRGIARISNNVAVHGISKIAYSFLPLREEEEEEEFEQVEEKEEYGDFNDVIGVTDEVLAFARNIACHPETWLDFPLLSDDDEEFDDPNMSGAQQDHALVIESLAPRLAALRIELCPTHMSIGCFWKIYFALLHPRLNKHDADLLSTPQIVEARALLHHGLQNRAKQESEDYWRHSSFKDAEDGLNSPNNFGMEKHSNLTTLDAEFIDKFVVNEEPYLPKKNKEMVLEHLDDDDDNEWPEVETQDMNNAADIAAILDFNADDISFSDLEEEDCFTKQAFSKIGSKSEGTLNM